MSDGRKHPDERASLSWTDLIRRGGLCFLSGVGMRSSDGEGAAPEMLPCSNLHANIG
jgi:hypothetical protein